MNTAFFLRFLGCYLGSIALLAAGGPQPENQSPALRITAPVSGARYAPGASVPFRVEAKDPDGYATHAVFFVDGRKVGEQSLNFIVAPPPGETQVFEGAWTAAGIGSRRFSVLVTDNLGGKADAGVMFQVGAEPEQRTLIQAGAEWRYHALNQDLGTAWVTADFNDQSWPVGRAQLGFGDGDEATKVPATEPRQPTVYFRRSFEVPADGVLSGLVVRLLRDDGARVWLNGQSLLRDNLPDGEIKFSTLAAGSAGENENAWHEFRVSGKLLKVGSNLLAVEVHQVALTSSDLSFDLELAMLSPTQPPNLPVVSIEAKVPTTAEGCITCRIAPGVFALRRTGDPSAPLAVWLAYSGTAKPGQDYAQPSARVEFPAGAATLELFISGQQDDLVEGPETVVATVVGPPTDGPETYLIDPEHRQAKITINDTTPQTVPEVSIRATRDETREPFLCVAPPCPLLPEAAPAVFTVSRLGGNSNVPLTVPLAFSGTALHGVDYAKLPAEVVIPAGKSTVEILVTALADGLSEPDETVIAQILIPPGLPDVPPPFRVVHGEAKVVIHNLGGQTIPVVSLAATQPTTSEGCPTCLVAPGVFQLTRTGPTEKVLRVRMSYGGTALVGSDYEKLPEYVEIPAGKASKDLLVLARYDQVEEGAETVVARIEPDLTKGALPQYEVNAERREAQVVIQDAPGTVGSPVVRVSASRGEISECPPQLQCKIPPVDLVFHRSEARLNQPLTVFIRWSGAAIWGVDYRVTDDGAPLSSVTFAAGSALAKLQLSALSDCLIEGPELAIVEILPDPTLGPIERYRVDSQASLAKVALLDGSAPGDGVATVSIEAGGNTLERCPPNARCRGIEFVLHRSGGRINEALMVPLKFSGTATAGKDYGVPEATARFAPGEATARVVLGPLDDALVEGDETVIATLECSDAAEFGYRIVGAHASATVVLTDDDSPAGKAIVEILEPKNGAIFTDPESILIRARTLDPRGTMTTLAFYAGDQKLGESTIYFIREPDPGLPLVHEWVWKNPPAGEHKLHAEGTDSTGQRVISAAVLVRVVRGNERPVVTVKAGVAETREVPAGTKIAVIPGTFVLHRTGATTKSLRVLYSVSGSAKNGRDYRLLDGDATFAAGQSTREIQVVPLTDALVEDDEAVELTLLKKNTYEVGSPGAARVVIHDAPNLHPGSVVWLGPQDGSRWAVGSDIPLKVSARDPAGHAVVVDFLANGKLIGSVPLITCLSLNCEPKPGATLEFTFPWKSVSAGEYSLVAVAKGLQGRTFESAPLKISVSAGEPAAFVSRDLPTSYRVGVAFRVFLRAVPPLTAGSYAVEDHPPKGWVVTSLGEGGGWDASHGAVKFGPFQDGRERVLSYDIVPAGESARVATFFGEASVNGDGSPIGGDQTIAAEQHTHPADVDPADWSIGLNEATAYGAAWKAGLAWPDGPSPIPLDYVTRAGALWRGGERYRFDAAAGGAPLWWVSERSAGKPASMPDLDLEPSELNAALQQLRERQSFVSAVLVRMEAGVRLQVHAVPGERVSAQALEIHLPPGTTVGELSDGGVYDAAGGIVRWGPFQDGASRRLTAQVNGSVANGGHAQFSADGQSITVPVVRLDASSAADPHIAEVRRLPDGSVQLFVVDATQQGGQLEYSDDLLVWHRIGDLAPGADGQVHDDTDADESQHRYYRAVRMR